MTRVAAISAAVLTALFSPAAALAVPISLGERANGATATVGFEPELTLSLQWLRALSSREAETPVAAGLGVKVAPLALFEHGTWRVDVLLTGEARDRHGLGATMAASAYVVHDRNDVARLYGLGLEARVAPGYRSGSWQGGLDLGWQGTLLTHVRHTDLTRRTFGDRYPGDGGTDGPRDGWYRATAHRFRVGLQGAHALDDRVALSMAAGMLASYQSQGVLLGFDLAQVPFYVEWGVRVGW